MLTYMVRLVIQAFVIAIINVGAQALRDETRHSFRDNKHKED
jgi:hypothetical protein